MRKYMLAAVAAAAIASPAAARDGSVYVGVELGGMIVEDSKFNFTDDLHDVNNAVLVDYSMGFDGDLVAGYDFGMFRGELELGYKRAGIDEVQLDPALLPAANAENTIFDADGHGRVLSVMGNVMIDFGGETGWSGFLGAGAGLASVKVNADFDATVPTVPGTSFGFSDTDSGLAYQVIAGVRTALTDNIDVGLKYRYFTTKSFDLEDDADNVTTLHGRWQSHSLLASLIYNFYTPAPPPPAPPPPPPPPPAPATQTCPDGTVILATEACPAPPPPPPPPPPAPERG
jgi:OmpA-OmpF porin, OOP family